MKYFLSIVLSFIACVSLVHAAEETWGLSNSKCEWVRVRQDTIEDGGQTELAWKKCEGAEEGCMYKFCSGPPTDSRWEMSDCNKYCITLQETIPLDGINVKSISGDSGVDLLGNYFGLWYKIGALVLGLIGVLVIVISGVQIIFGGASEDGISSAKTRILAAILSLILLFSSTLILRTINPLFFK